MGLFSRTREVAKNSAKLSGILRERGYVYQHSGSLEDVADGPQRMLYLGIDPTSDSMHVGHLQAMLVLRRFLEAGHSVILVLGGGTGMIGDPSGKSEERTLLDEKTLEQNAAGTTRQAKQLFRSDRFKMMNNLDWLGSLGVIEFLRDIGKHFSVNAMTQRDSVKERLENREQGISYTEFSYMLLQAYDFLHLHTAQGCDLQVGASDQWGNMVSGADLIRRKTGDTAHVFSFPLLVNRSTGKKFGKTEGGAVWLDPKKTSPFDFYQFWFNTADDEVGEYLLKMTLMPKAEIDEVLAAQSADPSARPAQKRLAYEVTALVHGAEEANKAKDFKNIPAVSAGKLRDAIKDFSISELRRLVEQGGVSVVDGEKITTIDAIVNAGSTVRIGKNKFYQVK